MDPKVILSFVATSIKLVKELSGLELYKSKINIKRAKKIQKPVAVIIEFHEDIRGCIIYEFDKGLSVKIVDNMIKDIYGKGVSELTNEEFKEIFDSTIGELANQISGNTTTELYNEGIKIKISPPLVVVNKTDVLISHKQYVEAVLDTIYGGMVISILFDEFLDLETIKGQ
jgi:CheY-specific phosphatase CheX